MWASAIASSSAVVMPGRTAPRSSSNVSPTTTPARRICWTCSRDLIWIMRRRFDMAHRSSCAQRVEDAARDLVHPTEAVDLDEQAAFGVQLGQRRGLLVVERETAPDHVLRVVAAPLLPG